MTKDSLLASYRSGGRGTLAAALCVLALVFNLLGAATYAEAWRGAATEAGMGDLFICHAAPELQASQPAEPGKASPAWKCPLCMVHSAGLTAPLAEPTVLSAAKPAATMVWLPSTADTAVRSPTEIRPGGPRAPPLPV
jgi:hypothetical protein